MKLEINLALCALVILTGSSQIRGQSSVLPPVFTSSHTGTSASPQPTEGPGNDVLQTHDPTSRNETSTEATAKSERTVHSENAPDAEYTTSLFMTNSAEAASLNTNTPTVITQGDPTASPSDLSFTLTVQSLSPSEGTVLLTTDALSTFSSQSDSTAQDTSSVTPSGTLTTAPIQPPTAGVPQGLVTARAAGPAHQDAPSELNVGDEDRKGPHHPPSSPLDPLLAGILSVFIVATAVAFVILFLKFRQRTNHPEFHRLQDLPMDDLMEDTPLSKYPY